MRPCPSRVVAWLAARHFCLDAVWVWVQARRSCLHRATTSQRPPSLLQRRLPPSKQTRKRFQSDTHFACQRRLSSPRLTHTMIRGSDMHATTTAPSATTNIPQRAQPPSPACRTVIDRYSALTGHRVCVGGAPPHRVAASAASLPPTDRRPRCVSERSCCKQRILARRHLESGSLGRRVRRC